MAHTDPKYVVCQIRWGDGKSFVVADSGYVVKDPDNVWMELGFDVRKFPFLFRDALYSFGYFLPKAQYHVGFMVQATEDELKKGLPFLDISLTRFIYRLRIQLLNDHAKQYWAEGSLIPAKRFP